MKLSGCMRKYIVYNISLIFLMRQSFDIKVNYTSAKALWCTSSLVHKLFGVKELWRKSFWEQMLLALWRKGSLPQRKFDTNVLQRLCDAKAFKIKDV